MEANREKLSIDDHEHIIKLYNLPLMKKRAVGDEIGGE